MGNPEEEARKTVRLAEHRMSSASFWRLYEEGMDLIEETGPYLEGEGYRSALLLGRAAMALYRSESMRLTTRLMQIASWLLLQRAAHSGELTRDQVVVEKAKVPLDTDSAWHEAGWDELPERFVTLVERSLSLQARVRRMDEEIYPAKGACEPSASPNPVGEQINLLRTAFLLH